VSFLDRWKRRRLEKERVAAVQAPEHLRRMVFSFANANPRATRVEWVGFAGTLAEEAYATGYVRGLEQADEDNAGSAGVTPEQVADLLDPSWRERAWNGESLAGPADDQVPEARTHDDAFREQAEAAIGKFRRL